MILQLRVFIICFLILIIIIYVLVRSIDNTNVTESFSDCGNIQATSFLPIQATSFLPIQATSFLAPITTIIPTGSTDLFAPVSLYSMPAINYKNQNPNYPIPSSISSYAFSASKYSYSLTDPVIMLLPTSGFSHPPTPPPLTSISCTMPLSTSSSKSSPSSKRKALVYTERDIQTQYNSKFLLYDIMFKERGDPFSFTEVRFSSSYTLADGNVVPVSAQVQLTQQDIGDAQGNRPLPNGVPAFTTKAYYEDGLFSMDNLAQNIAWLFDVGDCSPGDFLFLFIVADGLYNGPTVNSSQIHSLASRLPKGVTLVYYTGSCGGSCVGNCPMHYLVDRSTMKVVQTDCSCTICHNTVANGEIANYTACMAADPKGSVAFTFQDPTPMLANVITIQEHQNSCAGAWGYNAWHGDYEGYVQMAGGKYGYGNTANLFVFMYYNLGNMFSVTLEEFMLEYCSYYWDDPDFVPFVGLSDASLLKQPLPFTLPSGNPLRTYTFPVYI